MRSSIEWRTSWSGSACTSARKLCTPLKILSKMRSSIGSGTHHGDSLWSRPRSVSRFSSRNDAEALEHGVEQALVVAALDADVDRPGEQRGDVDLAQAALDHAAEGVLDVVGRRAPR